MYAIDSCIGILVNTPIIVTDFLVVLSPSHLDFCVKVTPIERAQK